MPITRRTVLTLVAVVIAGSGGYAAWSYTQPNVADEPSWLTVEEAHAGAIGGNLLLIDIRRPDEWARTGIAEGALPLDMRRPDFTEALIQATGGDRATPVALICAAGGRSARLSRQLADAGFTRLIDVPEGMMGSRAGPGWLAKGLPVTPPS